MQPRKSEAPSVGVALEVSEDEDDGEVVLSASGASPQAARVSAAAAVSAAKDANFFT